MKAGKGKQSVANNKKQNKWKRMKTGIRKRAFWTFYKKPQRLQPKIERRRHTSGSREDTKPPFWYITPVDSLKLGGRLSATLRWMSLFKWVARSHKLCASAANCADCSRPAIVWRWSSVVSPFTTWQLKMSDIYTQKLKPHMREFSMTQKDFLQSKVSQQLPYFVETNPIPHGRPRIRKWVYRQTSGIPLDLKWELLKGK